MSILEKPVCELAYYQNIIDDLKKKGNVPVAFGCVDQQKPYFIYKITEKFNKKLIITGTEIRARELYEDYRAIDKNTYYYPAKDFIFYSADIRSNEVVRERLEVINHLINDREATIITTIDGCMDKLVPQDIFRKNTINIKNGDDIDIKGLSERLVNAGYENAGQTEHSGQFAIRGGIIDIFPVNMENPCRIELWDTEVDAMRLFDAESQRSVGNIEEIDIFPATELLIDDTLASGIKSIEKDAAKYSEALNKEAKITESNLIKKNVEELKEKLFVLQDRSGLDSYVKYFIKNPVSLADYFDYEKDGIVIDEPVRIIEKMDVVEKEFRESMSHRLEKGSILPGQTEVLYSKGEVFHKLALHSLMAVSVLDCKIPELNISGHYDINAKGIGSYNNSFETLVSDIKNWKKKKYRILIVSGSEIRARRLAKDLMENDIMAAFSDKSQKEIKEGEVVTVCGKLRKGYEYPDIRFAAVAEDDIFSTAKKPKKKKKSYDGKSISDFSELSIGDYVIHENHGLGIYRGIEKIRVDKTEKDYIKIEYANGGNLYILATQLDMIQKYGDREGAKPKLNRLGSSEWTKTKTKVRGAVKQVADKLIKLYASRSARQGFAFSKDTPWQQEFEELFPYEPTTDQLTAIEETKTDMESTRIMDRLICGDVGFGKTEVALRAAFKAVQDNKQVVYLCPTTILAKQIFTNFDSRMKDFGVEVRMLSRFCTPKEAKNTIEGLKKGLVDVVVGTHKILSKDVSFKNLGLLIIDEEQRFGVAHKEKIKQMKESVDVITLSATPIPRTLHMSLIGIRDMSVLMEPPVDRIPIQTFVTEYDEEMVREAVNRELARGGQVYYVYNKVLGIDEITLNIAKLVPEANVAFAHGQMSERELEKIMMDFINGDIDVLVSTTIIETGLDIPNVNTIIIHDANKYGLSQLYQLRGRVGRTGRMAYAFLMYKKDKVLSEIAEKRLSAIREFTDLGSGFRIAMKDLEIRGAGNMLGEEQHGHMEAVGYDLYCKMLNEAVLELKGEGTIEDYETVVDIDVDAYIPATYIRSENQKLDIYKRIAAIETEEDLADMTDELIDRFGDIPKPAVILMSIALLKSKCHSNYITEIKGNRKEIKIRLYHRAMINPAGIPDIVKKKGIRMKFTTGESPYFTYYFEQAETKNTEEYIRTIDKIVDEIGTLKISEESK